MSRAPHAEVPYECFEHPADEADLAALIQRARVQGRTLRVRGALHSERGSVLSEANAALHVMLDRFTALHFDLARRRVRAGAGISLGGDPRAPRGRRNPQREPALSLFHKLHAVGLALPVTGGITHQTLSGFLSTGAEGGSVRFSLPETVRELSLLDGTSTKRVLRRGDPHFDAALVSLGLLGVLTEVVLDCEDAYDVIGLRSTQPERACDFALFDDPAAGRQTLVDFLRIKPYARALWWPQPGLERVELWEAARFDPTCHRSYADQGPLPPQRAGVPSPARQLVARLLLSLLTDHIPTGDDAHQTISRELLAHRGEPLHFLRQLCRAYRRQRAGGPPPLQADELARVMVDLLARLLGHGHAPAVLHPAPGADAAIISAYQPLSPIEELVCILVGLFVELSPKAAAPWRDPEGFVRRYCGELFRDPWHLGLPMDDPVDDDILPVTFTEMWLPLDRAPEAMRALRTLFRAQRLRATGTFAIELYAAKKSPAWLSPSQGADVFRVDPFWYDNGDEVERRDFFEQFWETLAPFEARLHWGKALSTPEAGMGVAQREAHYARLQQFRELRKIYDPAGVFLSRYWQQHLGLTR